MNVKTGAKSSPDVKSGKAILLRKTYQRLERAKRLGSYIEVIALLETLMSDRLEVLESMSLGEPGKVDTLGRLINRVKKLDLIPTPLLEGLEEWSKSRNLAVHRLVKITDSEEMD